MIVPTTSAGLTGASHPGGQVRDQLRREQHVMA
jgi:hypothetical protein